jgi:hypothetical protein
MKIILKFTAIILLLVTGLSCEKEVTQMNKLVKDLFCFKEGSIWVYYDSISETRDTMTITNYKSYKFCVKKGAYGSESCDELISISGTFLRDFDITLTTSSRGKSNTASTDPYRVRNPLPFEFTCDENNNFYMFNGNVTFLPTYQLNEEEYLNVYLFEHDNSKYYIGKNVGAIRIVKTKVFDYVLISKNIKQ